MKTIVRICLCILIGTSILIGGCGGSEEESKSLQEEASDVLDKAKDEGQEAVDNALDEADEAVDTAREKADDLME